MQHTLYNKKYLESRKREAVGELEVSAHQKAEWAEILMSESTLNAAGIRSTRYISMTLDREQRRTLAEFLMQGPARAAQASE